MHTLEHWITKAQKEDWCKRLWQKDPSLWSQDLSVQKLIANRLGWLDSESFLKQNLAKLETFAASIHPEVNHVVILGMGGSSLGTDVLSQIFSTQKKLGITVIDSTDADYIRQLHSEIDFSKTLFMVCSKSGNTLEVEALRKHFESLCKNKSLFLAITDPGTTLLESMSAKYGYQEPWINPQDIGGRFSVMSFFGMLPAAAAGLDVKKMYSRLRDMQALCQKSDLTQNPGFELGLFLGLNALVGRNKLTLLMPEKYASFGIWIEQLIAESTGKKGLGLLPVVNETMYQNSLSDRCYVNYRGDVAANENSLTYAIEDPYDLAGEFLKWKIATAVVGMVLNINPFDEPDVNRSKDNTRLFIQPGAIKPYEDFLTEVKGLSAPIEAIHTFLAGLKAPEYGCLLAYLPYTSQNILQVDAWCKALAEKYQVPFVSGFGPRFLHSTGQFHKGGTNQGRFIQITCTNTALPIHGWDFGFETLKLAQALGDFQAMKSCDRKVINIHLDTPQLPKMS